jgi:mobilome CxxCx(11)CxxC protein
MLDSSTRERIEQEQLNCLCAKHLHVRALEKLNRQIRSVDALALIVPVLYFPLRYLSKGTTYSFRIEAAWEILAACLIAAAILKFVMQWQERFKNHGRLLGENISLARQASSLLDDNTATPESAGFFLDLAGKAETADRELIGEPRKKNKQFAYREALKEQGGASALCGACHSSPWNFIQGSCEACGNTPARRKSH